MDITKLRIRDRNPRKITPARLAQLSASIEEFGNMLALRPIVYDPDTMEVLGGNQRLTVLLALGHRKVPAAWVKSAKDLTPEERRRFVIMDNEQFGEWDQELLKEDYSFEELTNWGVEITWKEAPPKKEALADGYVAPLGGLDTKIKRGDTIDIGQHRLVCGDATSNIDWGKLMGEEQGQIMITDPPYNVDYKGTAGKIMNDKMGNDQYFEFCSAFFLRALDSLDPGSPIYVWHADTYGHIVRTAMITAGAKLSECLIWVKSSLVLGRNDYHWKHEPCLYGWKEGAAHFWNSDRSQTTVIDDEVDYSKMSKAELLSLLDEVFSERTPTTVMRYKKPSRNESHPTMKPVPLIGYQMENSSQEHDIVLDPFGGSGTTMVAAHQLGRNARLLEMDPRYAQVIVTRMQRLDPELDIRINNKKYTGK